MQDQHIDRGHTGQFDDFDSQRVLACTFMELNGILIEAVEDSPIGVYNDEICYTRFIFKSDGTRDWETKWDGDFLKEEARARVTVTWEEAEEQPLRWNQRAGVLMDREAWDGQGKETAK